MNNRTASAAIAVAGLGVGIRHAAQEAAQSSLGPFTISACMLGWEDGADDGQFFTSQSAAQAAPIKEIVTQGSVFTVTLTATADLEAQGTLREAGRRPWPSRTRRLASAWSAPDHDDAGWR